MPPRRLLVVSYYYPPDPSVGGNRWAAMVAYLRRAGHDVTVLTTSAYGALPDDGDRVVRTADLQTSATLRRLLRRPAVVGSPSEGAKGGALAEQAGPPPTLLNQGLVPDAHVVTWLPSAVRAARRIVREQAIDCVITSAPPDSVALLPLALGRRRPAWVADFRDGWRFEPLRGDWPTSVQDRLDAALERRVATTAEVVVGATRPIADDFAGRPGVDAHYVPNAWDPALDPDVARATVAPAEPDTVRLVHTGQLSGPRGRDPRPLFAAMRRLIDERGEPARRLRLVLVGGLDANEERMLAELDVRELVHALGQQSRMTAVATQRTADALLLLTSPGHASQATGKIYEYLAADRPIVALARGNEAARIVEQTGTGVTVDPTDEAAIADALGRLLDGGLAIDATKSGELTRYRYPAPAEEIDALVERAIARRASA